MPCPRDTPHKSQLVDLGKPRPLTWTRKTHERIDLHEPELTPAMLHMVIGLVVLSLDFVTSQCLAFGPLHHSWPVVNAILGGFGSA